MKCDTHKEINAVDKCNCCGRQLCSQCVNQLDELTFCKTCIDRERSDKDMKNWENEGGALATAR